MITSMFKREHGKTIYAYGDLTAREVYEMKTEGWKVEQKDSQKGKNGIQQEGARPWQDARDVGRHSKRRRA